MKCINLIKEELKGTGVKVFLHGYGYEDIQKWYNSMGD